MLQERIYNMEKVSCIGWPHHKQHIQNDLTVQQQNIYANTENILEEKFWKKIHIKQKRLCVK